MRTERGQDVVQETKINRICLKWNLFIYTPFFINSNEIPVHFFLNVEVDLMTVFISSVIILLWVSILVCSSSSYDRKKKKMEITPILLLIATINLCHSESVRAKCRKADAVDICYDNLSMDYQLDVGIKNVVVLAENSCSKKLHFSYEQPKNIEPESCIWRC